MTGLRASFCSLYSNPKHRMSRQQQKKRLVPEMGHITYLPSKNKYLEIVANQLGIAPFNPKGYGLPANGRFTKSADGKGDNCFAIYTYDNGGKKTASVNASRCMVMTPPAKLYGINHKKKGSGATAIDDPEKMQLTFSFANNGDDEDAKEIAKQFDEVVFDYCVKNKPTLLMPKFKTASEELLREVFHGLCSYKMTDNGKDLENPKMNLNVPYDMATDRINVKILDMEIEEDEKGDIKLFLTDPVYDPDSTDPAMMNMRKEDVQALIDPEKYQYFIGFTASGLWQTQIGLGVNKKVVELWRLPTQTTSVSNTLKSMMRSRKRPAEDEGESRKTSRTEDTTSPLMRQLESENRAIADAAAPRPPKTRDDAEASALLNELDATPAPTPHPAAPTSAPAKPSVPAATSGGPKPPARSMPLKSGPAK